MNRPELLSPAGDLEKLKTAIDYGADAVYMGGENFSLRAGAGGFSYDEMLEGLKYAHERGKKCYLTVNIFAHNEDIEPLREFLGEIKDFGFDGFLVSDPGIIGLVKEVIPDGELHLSTQANMTNYLTAGFWYSLGVKRLVLARELSLKEIREIRDRIPEDMELEAFVHGSMCISYSGRCLLSNFMANRDSNRGACAHPCRWKYVLEEEKRPGEYYPIEEDDRGSYIMNSRDLCMIDHIEELCDAGISSLKIEGRMKSVFYVATITNAYRMAIDAIMEGKYDEELAAYLRREVRKVSHREFTTGFFYDKPNEKDQNYGSSNYTREYKFTGLVLGYDPESGYALVEQRNKMTIGEEIEIFGPGKVFYKEVLLDMEDALTGEKLESAPHPQQMLRIKLEGGASPGDMIRKKSEGE